MTVCLALPNRKHTSAPAAAAAVLLNITTLCDPTLPLLIPRHCHCRHTLRLPTITTTTATTTTTGASALYLYLYAIVYFFTKLDMTKFTSALIYFGYMGLAAATFFLLTGTIGFLACFFFLRIIYSSIKVA